MSTVAFAQDMNPGAFDEQLRLWFSTVNYAATKTELGRHEFSGTAWRMWNVDVNDARTPVHTVIRALIEGHTDGDSTLRDFMYIVVLRFQDHLGELLATLEEKGIFEQFKEIFIATKDLPNWGS